MTECMSSVVWIGLCLHAALLVGTELASSNKPEQEDTLPGHNEHSLDSNCNANSQCVNDNEETDENRNPSGRGD